MIISSGFSAYTAYQQFKDERDDELKKRLENLRAVVVQIVDGRNEYLQAVAVHDAQFAERSRVLNTKREILIENADALLSGIEKDVNPAVYFVLASEESLDGRANEAERYYKLGIESKHIDPINLLALRKSLGAL